MPEYKTPPINTSVALTQADARATTYFKHWLDVIWQRTGGFTDIASTVADLQTVEYVVGASATVTDNERVGTSTPRIAWDFGTSGQAKVDLVAGSVTYAYIQDVSATDKILGRASVGAGDIEEIDCTPFARTLLDDVDAATARATLGIAASSTVWTEYEIDFGSTPVYDATFTVVDAAVSGTTEVAVVQSGATATGRAAGDALFDSITYAAVPGAGQFTLYALAMPGPVVGKRKILYQVGA